MMSELLTDTWLTVTLIRITAMGLIMISDVILFQINIFKETSDGKQEFPCSFEIKNDMWIILICSKEALFAVQADLVSNTSWDLVSETLAH